MSFELPAKEILAHDAPGAGTVIGRSRDGRDLVGYRFGHGDRTVSLIGGCHADEPVGPAMLDRLAAYLATLPDGDPLLARLRFFLVPHANPDGEARNTAWTAQIRELPEGGSGYDLRAYLRHAVRELPGDDVEFGFPRDRGDTDARPDGVRPENRAIAEFLADGAPFALHGSFHGMAFAAGPWFLIEEAWAERSAAMRESLLRTVAGMGYDVHDVDRGGEKGFHRIGRGFTTRPDSGAMIAHFRAAGDEATAALFRPSSMEHVRSLGGDPLTLVSEMPLFLLPAEHYRQDELVRPPAVTELQQRAGDPEALAEAVARHGVRPMAIADQMRLQLAFLEESLNLSISS